MIWRGNREMSDRDRQRVLATLADVDRKRNNRRVDDRLIEMARVLRAKREAEGGLGREDRAQLILAEAAGATEPVKEPTVYDHLDGMDADQLGALVSEAAHRELQLRARDEKLDSRLAELEGGQDGS